MIIYTPQSLLELIFCFLVSFGKLYSSQKYNLKDTQFYYNNVDNEKWKHFLKRLPSQETLLSLVKTGFRCFDLRSPGIPATSRLCRHLWHRKDVWEVHTLSAVQEIDVQASEYQLCRPEIMFHVTYLKIQLKSV